MTYNQFVNRWLGRFCDYDGKWGYQCTDLMRYFIKEVTGINPYVAVPAAPTAKQIFYNFKDNAYYKKINNTPTNIPQRGDIVFFKTSILPPYIYGIPGHVAIFDSGDVKSMILFEQNYPTNSPCRFGRHTYKDCLGWLRRK